MSKDVYVDHKMYVDDKEVIYKSDAQAEIDGLKDQHAFDVESAQGIIKALESQVEGLIEKLEMLSNGYEVTNDGIYHIRKEVLDVFIEEIKEESLKQ